MNVIFGSEKLEVLSSKFILSLAEYFYNQDINKINVISVNVEPGSNDLMEKTTIQFKDYNNHDYILIVSHAKDMSCSNWDLKK